MATYTNAISLNAFILAPSADWGGSFFDPGALIYTVPANRFADIWFLEATMTGFQPNMAGAFNGSYEIAEIKGVTALSPAYPCPENAFRLGPGMDLRVKDSYVGVQALVFQIWEWLVIAP